MKSWSFILSYWRFILGGFLLSFCSGFGQSFFISIFTPVFIETLNIDQLRFGFIYAIATMASGFLLPSIGGRLDRSDAIRYTRWATIGFVATCVWMANLQTQWMLIIGLFGLRLFGQGLFSHISATLTAKGFYVYRGRALSLTSLGFPFSEAILPLVAVFLLGWVGWRWAWGLFALFLAFFVMPIAPKLLSGQRESEKSIDQVPTENKPRASLFNLPAFTKTPQYWFLVLGSILPGTLLTGLFLYHSLLAEQRGWSAAWMASGFIWFAGVQTAASLIGGAWTDRITAKRLFGFYLLPLACGMSLLSWPSNEPWLVPLYLSLAGATAGIGSTVRTAIWAEIYGSREVAKLRSWAVSVMVTGTAVSAPILGACLHWGFGFESYLRASALLILLYTLAYAFWQRLGRAASPKEASH